MSLMDEFQLLERCQKGDAFAVERLVQTFQKELYRLALSIQSADLVIAPIKYPAT